MSPAVIREKKHHSGSSNPIRFACPYAAMGKIQRLAKNSPCSGKGFEDIPHFIEHIKRSHVDQCGKSKIDQINKTRRVSKQKTAEEKVEEIYRILFGHDVAIPNVHVQSIEYYQHVAQEKPAWLLDAIQQGVQEWNDVNSSVVLNGHPPEYALDVMKFVFGVIQNRGAAGSGAEYTTPPWNQWTPDSYSWQMSSSDESGHDFGYSSNSSRSSDSGSPLANDGMEYVDLAEWDSHMSG